MRILFLTPRPPWPTRRGDQARASTLIAGMAARHEVRVVTLRPAGFPSCRWPDGVTGEEVPLSWPRALAATVGRPNLPLQVAMHTARPFVTAVRQTVADWRPDAAVVVLSRLGGALDELGDVPTVLDLVDSLHLNLANRAARQPMLARLLRWEARRIAAYDRAQVRRVAHATVVSRRDLADLATGDGVLERRMSVLPVAVRVPVALPAANLGGNLVLLHGNLGYFPTVDGALWFAREVWPVLRRLYPGVEWRLAGARPARALRSLARLQGVSVVADPDDLAIELAGASVVAAPLRSGSGTPNKILEAMAAGVPVVTTPAAAAGLDDLAGNEIAVASDNWQLAQAIARLLTDPDAARRQVEAAWRYVRRRHAIGVVAAELERIIERIVTP